MQTDTRLSDLTMQILNELLLKESYAVHITEWKLLNSFFNFWCKFI